MQAKAIQQGAAAAVVAMALAGAAWFVWPRAIQADLAVVARGPMEVTVHDDGRTRVREIYTVSAPVAGRIVRNPHKEGDPVTSGESVVAILRPAPPGFLDDRTRAELGATLSAADAAVRRIEHEVARLEAELEFSRADLTRIETLARDGVVAERALEEAETEITAAAHALAAAQAELEMQRGERARIEARLAAKPGETFGEPDESEIRLRAPATGQVLRVLQESETVVAAGTPLIQISDPNDLEIVADLLSTDAVRIDVGAPARIVGWGGPPISGRVAQIEPAGFPKVSALGIEELRVETIIEITDPVEKWQRLGHDFRVIVEITVWQEDDAVTVPVGAMFRNGESWAVFAVRDGRARLTQIEIGHRNEIEAEVRSGVAVGDRVILYPSDRIAEGVRVSPRRIE